MASSHKVTDWIVEYTLSEPCGYTRIQNSPSIELRTECDVRSKSERIIGFSIRVNSESNEQEVKKKANQQAKRLTDIITFKREKRVTPYLAGLMEKIGTDPDRWKTSKFGTGVYHILKNIQLDLLDNSIIQMIENDKDINHRLHHAGIAIGAEELQLFVTMFTELFQVIEVDDKKKKRKKKLPKYYFKYKALRNAISHRQLDPTDPRAAMAQVNRYYHGRGSFEFTPTNEFNYNSEKNIKQIKSEANKLKKRAMSYLNRKV